MSVSDSVSYRSPVSELGGAPTHHAQTVASQQERTSRPEYGQSNQHRAVPVQRADLEAVGEQQEYLQSQ